ncbi:MAG: phage portal protein, partial [Chloroflexi bacterium]
VIEPKYGSPIVVDDVLDGNVRINVYYPDRIEKYATDGAGQLYQYVDQYDAQGNKIWPQRWLMPDGTPIGVPVVHFRNKKRHRNTNGISEILQIIGLQNTLNRLLYSMVATMELAGFPVRTAVGFSPPAAIAPGSWVVAGEDGVTRDQVVEMGVMAQAELRPFIEQGQWIVQQIAAITKTPLIGVVANNDNLSGESLKQREIGLLSKVKKLQITFGNSWENVMWLAARLQAAFGRKNPPVVNRWYCRWRNPHVRNDTQVIQNALMIKDYLSNRQFLSLIANVYDFDESKIDKILSEKEAENAARVASLLAGTPGFDNIQIEP